MLKVCQVTEDLDCVKDFYTLCDYAWNINPDETVIGAFDNRRIIGVVRLCAEHGVRVLRGMEITPAFQRKGVGTKMLHVVKLWIKNVPCYAITYPHLFRFYRQIGFRGISLLDAPKFLQERVCDYQSAYPKTQFAVIYKSATG